MTSTTSLALALLLSAALDPVDPSPPIDVDRWLRRAAEAQVAGDYEASSRALSELLASMDGEPRPSTGRALWVKALLSLAQVEGTLGRSRQARAAMERVLSVEPDLVLDPERYSPRFRREFEQVRASLAAAPHHRLQVTVPAALASVRIDGLMLGHAPARASLPAGRYRVEALSGIGDRAIQVDLARDESVTIDLDAVIAGQAAPTAQPVFPTASAALAPSAQHTPSASTVSLRQEAPASWMGPAAAASAGLAGVAAGIATWQGISAASLRADAAAMVQPDGTLKPGADPAAYAAAVSDFETARSVAWISAGSAVALGGAAVLLWVLAPGAPVAPAPGGLAIRY